MKQIYEISVLLHPDLEIDLEKPQGKIEELFKKAGGSVEAQDNWGKRHLAYPIKRQEYAIYLFYRVELPAGAVAGLEKSLLITDEVLRHMIVVYDEKLKAAAEQRAAAGDEDDEGDESKDDVSKKSDAEEDKA